MLIGMDMDELVLCVCFDVCLLIDVEMVIGFEYWIMWNNLFCDWF